MSLTLDQKSVENLGIGGKLEWHRKWGGKYTYNDGLGVYRNFIYRYIKLKREGDNMTFESWCQFNSYGSDCSDEAHRLYPMAPTEGNLFQDDQQKEKKLPQENMNLAG